MAEVLEWKAHRRRGDGYAGTGPGNELATHKPAHRLDDDKHRKLFRQLLQWYFYERDRQAANRLEMAVDHDFYDGLQWEDEDAQVLADRGQAPIVYNETAPTCDWIIGTERRNRVDWKVLPRTDDDVEIADAKTKVLKYVSDVNKVVFHRSRAFADAVKGGLGWVDDGVRDDPTKDIIRSGYEDWRCVLHDSAGLELDSEDWRYVFRWRHVDEDIALMMFPDREDIIRSGVEDYLGHDDPLVDEDTWTTPYDGATVTGRGGTYSMAMSSAAMPDAARRRVKLIECQFRMPVATKVITSGPLRGAYFDPRDTVLQEALGRVGGTVIDKIMMRVHVAVFTEAGLLACGPSIYRHNRFSLTPIWAYRRSRDRMPYGIIRRIRDIQRDLNKRASKALWLLNTNQLVGDLGAVDDVETARDEAQRPDGVILTKAGKELAIRRDTDAATGQMQLMAMDAQSIQKSAGVTDENLGRKTNAISGEAIKARQMQGAVVTTELFDNLRLAVQCQGEKQLSLVEQFYTEEKVIRLTGAKGALEWLRINVPEVQADGSVRYLNDITASLADFIVSEADYAGTLRQVMFDSMNNIAAKLPPEVALRFLTIAFEFSDLPNKDEISEQLRKLTGERDPSKPMTPEEAQQAAMQMQQQAEALEVAKATAMATLAEQQAKAQHMQAQAEKILVEIDALRSGAAGGDGGADQARELKQQIALETAVRKVQEAAAEQIDQLTRQLAKVQSDQATAVMKIRAEADTASEVATIEAASKERVAEIQAASDAAIAALLKRMETIATMVTELRKDTSRDIEDAKREAIESAKPEPGAEPAAAAAPAGGTAAAAGAQPVTLVVQATPAGPGGPGGPAAAGKPSISSVKFRYDKAGDVAGVVVKRDDGSSDDIKVERGGEGPKP